MDVELHTAMNGYTWELSHCFAADKYSIAGTYTEKCCVPNGTHAMSCKSAQNNEWVNAFVGIEGHMFCDDMIGQDKFIALNIPGKKASYILSVVYINETLILHDLMPCLLLISVMPASTSATFDSTVIGNFNIADYLGTL